MDTNERLRRLIAALGWSEYRLSKESGLSESTIGNLLRRNTVPSIATLKAVCDACGVTLSEFFAEYPQVTMDPRTEALVSGWRKLPREQQDAIVQLIRTMNGEKEGHSLR